MEEIKIVPIFNQSAPVWEDFLRIRVAAMRGNYNYDMPANMIAAAMMQLNGKWNRFSFNFALGAYCDDSMIGCIHGNVQGKTATIDHLYVLPEFQGQHVGNRLVGMVQNATSIGANYLELVALPGAEKFYKRIGFVSKTGLNDYVKDIRTQGRCAASPLFHCAPHVARACSELSGGEFNANMINKEHLPAFIHRDVDSNITGFGIITKDAPVCVTKSKRPDDMARLRLVRMMDEYIQNQK
ncbi:MAG: GNAT family N-acetyltransferase [Alphaproteobacteria bacterium]|nr:GNAT family N-acetyltransferase [Alphaproteobacteria bacterium]